MKKTLSWFAFFLIPLGSRLINIGGAPLWYDETFTAVLSRLPFYQMLAATMGDVHPPLWYVVTWAVHHLDSLPIWSVRLPAALFGAAGCWLFWALMGRLQVPQRVRLVAFGLMVASPFQLYFSQEGRMYTLLSFLVIAGLWSLLASRWTIFSLVLIALLYTHNYGLFYVACLALAALLLRWRDWYKVVTALACAGVAWSAWAGVLLWQMDVLHGTYWIQPPTLGNVLYTLSVQYFAQTMPNKISLPAIYTSDVLTLLAAGFVVWKRPKHWGPVLLMAAGPFGLALLASWVYQPVFLPRSLAGTAPFLYLLAAWPLAFVKWTRRRALYVACFLLPLAVVSVASYYFRVSETKGGDNLIRYARDLRLDLQPGDLICHTGDGSSVIMMAYEPDLPNCKLITPRDPSGSLTSLTRQSMGVQEMRLEDLVYRRLWIFAAITPMMFPEEIDYINTITPSYELVATFSDDQYTWFGVYYAEH